MKFYLTNAFSLNMLNQEGYDLALRPISVEGVKNLLANEEWKSLVGHPDTAAIMTSTLGVEVPVNRETAKFTGSDEWSLIVGQYTGPRLPEGAKIEFWQVYQTW